MLLPYSIVLDGDEYLVSVAGSARPQGYAHTSAAETRWVLRTWSQRGSAASVGDLLRDLGVWHAPTPPDDLEACIEELADRFDDHAPELLLYRRKRVAVALDLSEVEEAVDLVDAVELTPEPEIYWVEITFHDADGNPLADAAVKIDRPDGVTHEGRTNAAGVLRVSDISVAGQCTVSFPELEPWARQRFGAPT